MPNMTAACSCVEPQLPPNTEEKPDIPLPTVLSRRATNLDNRQAQEYPLLGNCGAQTWLSIRSRDMMSGVVGLPLPLFLRYLHRRSMGRRDAKLAFPALRGPMP